MDYYQENEDKLRDFANREVIYCASQMISELSSDVNYIDDIAEFSSQPDYEQAADYYISSMDAVNIVDDLTLAGFDADISEDIDTLRTALFEHLKTENELAEFCDAHSLEPDYHEAYEFWIITDWLAHKLLERGELITFDFLGFTIWGRCTTGQHISLDGVISQIHKDLN